MIDLDALENADTKTNSFELYCQLGILLVDGRINYLGWISVVRSLGIQGYVYPDQRQLLPELLDRAYFRSKKSSTSLMQAALLWSHIEAHFTLTHQARMLEILQIRGLNPSLPDGIITGV